MQERIGINHLRTHRRRLGLSQSDVAKLLGCQTGSNLTRWESGERAPSLFALLALHAILGLPIPVLFPKQMQRVCKQLAPRAIALLEKLRTLPQTSLVAFKCESVQRALERLQAATDSYDLTPRNLSRY